MKPYAELTRLGQLRRIRQLAELALEAYGLRGARLTFLRYFANITYRVDLPAPVPEGPAPSSTDLIPVPTCPIAFCCGSCSRVTLNTPGAR